MEYSKRIAYYAYEVDGDWDKIAEKIRNNDEPKVVPIHEKYTTILDSDYPNQLRDLRFPPWILFYCGNLALVNQKCVSIIGSRNPSAYGLWATEEITRKLANRYVIVSGLAKGIDAKAHETALISGKTIGVIGSGLSICYPESNKKVYDKMKDSHLILSEYPYYTRIKKHHFPWRNRIIAALSEACIVCEARYKSGTMLTVNEALTLSKEVYVVPHHIGEIEGEGCNLLIEQGAQIITSIQNLEI
ncbi:DNA-processing protein DprA [Anaerorhabdus sp.]|uniref:DNA-processing protein DprA n=1 Tax=Anaerorhabdus sp. TaxID=1872524 RepID=UPI002FC75B66